MKDLTQQNIELKQAIKRKDADNKQYVIRNQMFTNLTKQIEEFQFKMKEMNLSEQILFKIFGFTLDEVLKVKSKGLLKKGKQILESISLLSSFNENLIHGSTNPQESKKVEMKLQQKQQKKDVEDEKHQEVPSQLQSILDSSISQIGLSQDLSVLTLAGQLQEKKTIEYHQKCPSKINQLSNQRSQVRNRQEFYHQQNLVNRLTEFISLPIVWQKNQAFDIKERMITMKVDKWTKLRSHDPLPKSGKYSMKFKVITPGTMSFGLAIQPFKNGQYIYDLKQGVANYISFSNGKGIIRYNGQALKQSMTTYLPLGSQLEMIINFDTYQLTYCNQRDISIIKLNTIYQKYNVYLFLHMKDRQTAVKIL